MNKVFTMLAVLMAISVWPVSSLDKGRLAYHTGDILTARKHYFECIEAYPEFIPRIRYNIGQTYLESDSAGVAMEHFRRALHKDDPEIGSYALNNTGIIIFHTDDKDPVKKALSAFKDALRRNPDNEMARYNYELLLKYDGQQGGGSSDENEEEQDQDENDDQPSGNVPQNAPPQENSGDNADYDPINMDQARKMLEGMKQNEKKFIQELMKKSSKSSDEEGVPEW